MNRCPALSIVTSVYRTAQFLEPLAARLDAAANACGLQDYEMIFVVDGSPDCAIAALLTLKAANPRIRVIELSRNFGHHAALWCGIEEADGKLVFLTDSDLETPPEVLIELHAAVSDAGTDVAFACQRERREAWPRRFTSQIFWRVFGALADVRIHPNALTERLMRRRYVEALLRLGDRSLFLGGMMEWVGFCQVAVPATRTRRAGPPSYSFARRAALAFDALTSFSTTPMKMLFATGTGLAVVAVLAAISLIVVKIAHPEFIMAGFTALAVLILFSLGSILAAIGLVGLYLGKVFLQTKMRPVYIVREEF
jgi:putative glycosyltransferase